VRRSTSALTVGAAVAGALALSGCQVTSPQQTTVPYQPADGVNLTLGDVKVNDLVVITSAKGKEGVLSGQVITFAAPGGGPQLTKKVAAGSSAGLSGEAGVSPVTLPTVSVEPGSMLDLTIGTSAAGTDQVAVPVLLPDLYYSSITPAAPSASATTK
jgi:hypothetical protein